MPHTFSVKFLPNRWQDGWAVLYAIERKMEKRKWSLGERIRWKCGIVECVQLWKSKNWRNLQEDNLSGMEYYLVILCRCSRVTLYSHRRNVRCHCTMYFQMFVARYLVQTLMWIISVAFLQNSVANMRLGSHAKGWGQFSI